MPSFLVKGRKTSPLTPVTVDAETREAAISQVVAEAAEGEEIEVMSAEEQPADAPVEPPPVARSAAPGPAATEAKPTRAQLNEMSKDELLAVADKQGVDVNYNWNKADIVDAIVKHK